MVVTMRIPPVTLTLLLAASSVRAVGHWQLSPDASSALQLDTARVGRKEARLLLLHQEEEERPHSPERRLLQQQQQSAHDVKQQQLLGPTVECKSWCAETGVPLQETCTYRPCKQCKQCETLRKVPDCEAGEDDPQVPCVLWATQGECERNPEFMQSSCPASCPAPCHVPERVASAARQHRVGTTQTSPHSVFSAPAAAAAAAAALATTPATDPDADPAAAPASIPAADPDFAPLVDTDPGIEGDYHRSSDDL